MGGVLIGREVCDVPESDPEFVWMHGYTYSGQPVACAAAIANIDLIERDGLVERATHVGERLSAGLNSLMGDRLFDDVRGVGALWAAQLGGGDILNRGLAVRDRMLELGVVCRSIDGAIAFCPPLIIGNEDIDRVVDVCGEAVHDL